MENNFYTEIILRNNFVSVLNFYKRMYLNRFMETGYEHKRLKYTYNESIETILRNQRPLFEQNLDVFSKACE